MATTQINFRGRNDDGDQVSATWKANESTDFSQLVNTNFRLRIKVTNSSSWIDQLQYNLNSTGWNSVTTSSSVVKSVTSVNVADTTPTTEQLTASGIFLAGEVSADGITANHVLFSLKSIEDEFILQIVGNDVVNNDTIQLRGTVNGVAFNTYNVTPTVTVIKLSSATPGRCLLLGVG